MSFEVDRCASAWAHIALCADHTWTQEPADEFIVANRRLWTQHCRVSQVLQDSRIETSQGINKNCDLTDKQLAIQENGCSRRSVRDVIPESRLAQFYGNFYYDDVRENCYTCTNGTTSSRFSSNGCDNSDLTECWMLPEVEYWFCKLMDNSNRSAIPRRRRQYKILADDDLNNGYQSAASEPCGSTTKRAADEAFLVARIKSVRSIWNRPASSYQGRTFRAPSPPVPRKIRARRRQPKSLAALAPPPPAYCVDAPNKLFYNTTHKFQFDVPRSSQLTDYQRAMGRLSASVQALMRANASRCPPYRGTNISRYAPTIPRSNRYPDKRFVWSSREKNQHKNDKVNIKSQNSNDKLAVESKIDEENDLENKENQEQVLKSIKIEDPKPESSKTEQKETNIEDEQLPSTSAEAKEGLSKKRLYSTVLSTTTQPIQLNHPGVAKNINTSSGFIKLNPKYGLSSRLRTPNVDKKFEELEKEALEQYKDSDESIDTKFHELEKQAVEQYSTSNSNTSCSSETSGENKLTLSKSDNEGKEKRLEKSRQTKSVDSVVIYSQNFPDLNVKVPSLKNSLVPPRGEKKELTHRSKSLRNSKKYLNRPASDTDNETKDTTVKGQKGSKNAMRWTLHVMPPKKRHLTLCVSDFSSEEEIDSTVSIKDAGPCIKNHMTGKVKMSAHGGGDLHPIMRKT